jgi:membrane-associated phospholipid phosphatase
MHERTPGPHALSFGGYLAVMTGALLLAGNRPYLALYASLLALLSWLIFNRMRDPAGKHLQRECLFYAVAMNISFVAMAGAIPATRTTRYDDLLAGIDRSVFGIVPSLWAERFASPWLTELMSACYLFFMPLLAASLLRYFFRDKTLLGPFYRGLFTVYGIGFTGYFLVPAAGPYLSAPEMFSVPLEGGPIARLTYTVVVLGSNKVDVFPSLHCAVSAFILGFAWRHHRREFHWLLLPVAGLWLSTIYLRYHYVVDVVCGFALAALALALTSRRQSPPAAPSPLSTERSPS